jgi:hypothetical protein
MSVSPDQLMVNAVPVAEHPDDGPISEYQSI